MNQHLFKRRLRLGYLLASGDAVMVLASLAASYALLTLLGVRSLAPGDVAQKVASGGLLIVGVQVSVLYVFGLYTLQKRSFEWRQAGQLLLAVATGAVLISGLLFFMPKFLVGRQILLAYLPVVCATLLAWRYALYRSVVADELPRSLAIVGDRESVLDFIEEVRDEDLCDYTVTKACLSPPSAGSWVEGNPDLDGIEWSEDLDKLMGARDYHALALDLRAFSRDERIAERIIEASFEGIPVYDLITLQKDITGRYPTHAGEWNAVFRAFAARVGPNRYYGRLKRLADVVLGGAALVVGAIPMLLIAAAVKLESRGPAFFIQERLGYRRQPFGCIKFRTMVEGAERESGPVWASEDDPRITTMGKLLRKTRLDELPQFINVVKGEMTLVGPRPIRAHFADQLAKQIRLYNLRFAVKPGLTGWAQAHQRYVRTMEEHVVKFRYELFYLENCSLWLDLYTLVKTLRVVVTRRGG